MKQKKNTEVFITQKYLNPRKSDRNFGFKAWLSWAVKSKSQKISHPFHDATTLAMLGYDVIINECSPSWKALACY